MTDFSTFYGVYPRKTGKKCAQKTYNSAIKEVAPETLQKAVEAFAAIEHARTGYQNKKGQAKQDALQYTCHPATWLNQGRWEDEVITEHLEKTEVKFKPIEIDDDDPFKAGKLYLATRLGSVGYRAWVEALRFEQGENEVIIHAASKFHRDWIKDNYAPTFENAFRTRVKFVVDSSPPTGL